MCGNILDRKITVYVKDLHPRSVIKKIDATGKSDRELRCYGGASGLATKTKQTKVTEFFKNTTGLSLVEKKLICKKCRFSEEDSE